MNKRVHEHQWKIVRSVTDLEYKVTKKTYLMQCQLCGLTGYSNRRDLEWVKGDDKNE